MKRIKIEKAELIRQLKRNGLTVPEFAMCMGVSVRHIQNEIVKAGFVGVKDLRKRGK